MTTGTHRWPRTDLDLAAALRSQLDQSIAKRVELEHKLAERDQRIAQIERDVIPGLRAEADALRATLLGEAEIAEAENEPDGARAPGWWRAAWREVSRHRSVLLMQVQQRDRWLLEGGKEATQLQRDLTAAREVIGKLERQLDLARSGERAPVAEADGDADTVLADEEIH